MHIERVKRIVIWGLVLLICLLIWPVCLVRKDAESMPNLEAAYGKSDVVDIAIPVEQKFKAQTAHLKKMAIDVKFLDASRREGILLFVLLDDSEEEIYEEEIPLEEVNDGAFTWIDIDLWLKKGGEYSYILLFPDTAADNVTVLETMEEENHVADNLELTVNGTVCSGKSVTGYVYAFELNWKNVLCLWCFVIACGFTVTAILTKGAEEQRKGKAAAKVISLLERIQIPVVALEIGVILLLIYRICRNEAVHWDEAYTWHIVTKLSFGEMIAETASDVHPPLYYILVRTAMGIFGNKIMVAKLTSVAGALATMLLGAVKVRKNWGIRAAIPFTLVVGLGPQFIFYNVDVRMYSWMIFFVTGAVLFAYDLLRENKIVCWVLFILLALGGVYTQYFAVVPLFLLYLMLFLYFLIYERKRIREFLLAGVATVLGYLPWLRVVLSTLQRDAGLVDTEVEESSLSLVSLFKWGFGTNIVWSDFMPVILFVLGCLLFFRNRKNMEKRERFYVIFLGSSLFLTYLLCAILMQHIKHFWDYRYLVDVLSAFWLALIIFLCRKNLGIWCSFMGWLTITCLSSYTIMSATELGTVPWIDAAKPVFAPLQQEREIVYTFPTFQILYEYYLPNAEFVWYEDVDFDKEGGSFYMIDWGGTDFDEELKEKLQIEEQFCGSVRLEEGIAADIYYVTYEQAGNTEF